jgi:hypothetical protein
MCRVRCDRAAAVTDLWPLLATDAAVGGERRPGTALQLDGRVASAAPGIPGALRAGDRSAVIGCAVDELRADLPLTVEFHPASHAIDLPYFRPEDR